VEADSIVYQRTISPEDAPDIGDLCRDRFIETGHAVSIDGKKLSAPPCCWPSSTELGKANGIAASISSKTVSSHEVARRVRNARRHDSARGASRIDGSITLDRGAGPSQG